MGKFGKYVIYQSFSLQPVQKLFSLMYHHLLTFAFVACIVTVIVKKIVKTHVKEFLPYVSF